MLFVNKLKVLTLMTCLVLVGRSFALDCATGTGWGDFEIEVATKDTTDDYYKIDTPEKLAWISCKMKHDNGNFKTAKVKLTQSIDMQGNLGKVFIPIAAGTGTPPSFIGIFDGQGFTISNLYINTAEIKNDSVSAFTGKSKNGNAAYAQNIGLFGIISKEKINNVDFTGTVKNLTLKDVQIYAAASAGSTGINSDKPISVGTVVGWVSEGGKIENCVASGFIETSGATNRVGGIAGNVKSVTITNCVSSVSVTASGANTNVGGIVGALRNKGSITITSCVYSGNHLYTVDGDVGAIAGSYEEVTTIKTEDLFYSEEFCEILENPEECNGIGVLPNGKKFNTEKVEDLNEDDVVCALNGGTWNNGACTGDTSDVWSIGQSDISMNGSDGFKVTFVAIGGSFTPGAKTSKILAKGAAITADEIGVPTREGKKFAGWATTANAEEPTDLGVAHTAVSVYAVWYDFYEVTFKTGCDTAFSDATFPDSTKTKTVSVAKHGTISVDGFSVPTVYEIGTDENKVKYYFTGWAYASKSFDVNDTIAENDTLHLSAVDVTAPVMLYAVWTKAPTFSVTFDASLHGKTDVHFVKMVTEGETVSRPDTVITDDGYKVVGWCVVENCTIENEYSFTDSLKGNLVLHARWEIESYSINYELDGGTNAPENLTTYNVNSGDIVFAAPTKEGATFDGWFYDQEFTNPATQIGAGSTGDKKIYAKWTNATFIVQYLSGNTIYATAKNDTKLYGDTIQLKGALEEFVHGGCTQDGWSKVDYGQDGYGVDYALGADYAANENLKVFPHWNCNTYKITYEMYGMPATNRNDTSYTGPAKVTLENAFDPAKTDYFMDNWYKESSFKTAIRDIQNIDADLTLYARWYNKITYKPSSNVSGAKNLEEKKYFGKTYTFKSSIDKYVRANYTLDGWSTTDGGDKVYELGGKYNTNENLTLYPHWTPEAYPIVYHNIEGATFETPNPETYTVEDEFPIVLNEPAKVGFNFLGWSLEANSTDYVDGIAAGSTGEANFYANWELAPSPITVTASSGTFEYDGETHNATCSYEGTLPVGYSIEMVPNGSVRNVSAEPVTTSCDVTITDESGDDVTSLFTELTIVNGSMSVVEMEDDYGAIVVYTSEKGKRAELNGSYNGSISDGIPNDLEVDSIQFNRKFPISEVSGEGYSTIVLPFTIDQSKIVGAKFYQLAYVDGDNVAIYEVADAVQANTPYIIRTSAQTLKFNLGEDETVTFNFGQMNNTLSSDKMWELRGMYSYKKWEAGNEELGRAYGFTTKVIGENGIGSFARNAAGAYIYPFRVYLYHYSAPVQRARALAKSANISSIDEDSQPGSLNVIIVDPETEETTVIGKLNPATGEVKVIDNWYDMKGRRLNAKPTTKGIYYFNGKRVIIK